jgi:hypothetical protein
MSEKETIKEAEKNVQPEQPPVQPEQKEATPDATTPDQINWKNFREQREKERKEKIAIEQEAQRKSEEIAALKAAMEAILNKQQPVSHQTESFEDMSDEDRIKKQVDAAVSAALAEKAKIEEQQRREREAKEFPQKLVQVYSDFNAVCTADNLDYLEYHYPEVASAFKVQPEGFDKWSNIYKALKRFIPNTNAGKEAAKADKNLSKPQSMSVPGMAATGDSAPMVFDDKRRADNWARMQRVMKGL